LVVAAISPFVAVSYLYRIFKGGFGRPSWDSVGDWLYVALAWLVMTKVFQALFRRIRAFQVRRSELTLQLPGGEPARGVLEHAGLFRKRFDFLAPKAWRRKQEVVCLRGEFSSGAPDGKRETLTGGVVEELRGWAGWLGTLWSGVALVGPRRGAEESWEARIFSQVKAAIEAPSNPLSPPWQNFEFYRWRPENAAVISTSLREADTAFLVCSPRWHSEIEGAWKASKLRTLEVLFDWFQIEALVEWPVRVRALHVVGRPVEDVSGPALKVEKTREFLRNIKAQSPDAGDADVLITPGRRGMEQIPLLIVQAEPTPILELTDTDRRETRKLRGFSADMFMAGARAVLMIPAMHSDAAAGVMKAIARQTGSAKRLDVRALLALSRAVRDEIATWRPALSIVDAIQAIPGSPPSEESLAATQRELALNVTLFARHTFRHLKPSIDETVHG
ncbi:MAG: hypothetical protein ACREH8_06060, partial [Opitutaceae bacterium]